MTNTSLAEQKNAINLYAQRHDLLIAREFEERETAAKSGRPVFLDMLRELKKGQAAGLIIHKIDRSARNLRDWADLGALIDSGIEVHFVNESLDLNSRGGRLSADIQAVVAADYIRNLREETRKGILGRVRQGLFPFPARPGYLDQGAGKPKIQDPAQAPLVKLAFEKYASGKVGLNALVSEMYALGLRNRKGRRICRNGLVSILKNPFYAGFIRLRSIGRTFEGAHEPIISMQLFNQVQDVFAGKRSRKVNKHFFLYRRLIKCETCRFFRIPERHGKYVYYRCQNAACAEGNIPEPMVEQQFLEVYSRLELRDEDYKLLETLATKYRQDEPSRREEKRKNLVMELGKVEGRLGRLTDGFIDNVFDEVTYSLKQVELITKRQVLREQLKELQKQQLPNAIEEFLEMLKQACISFKNGTDAEKRRLLEITLSKCTATGKTLLIELKKPFQLLIDSLGFPAGSPKRATARNDLAKIREIFEACRHSQRNSEYPERHSASL